MRYGSKQMIEKVVTDSVFSALIDRFDSINGRGPIFDAELHIF
jgi:hypothetical protein